jgi:hypothetical protein
MLLSVQRARPSDVGRWVAYTEEVRMETLYRKIFSLVLTLIAVLVFTSGAKSQTGTRVDVAVSRGPHPAWEGKAAGDVQPFERNNYDLRLALPGQPVLDVWLEFVESKREGQPTRKSSEDKEPLIKVTLPPEAKELLKSYWEEALKFDYNEAFVKPRNAQEGYDRDVAWTRYCTSSTEKLQKIEIDAPDGRRNISDEEAPDLLFFLHKASASLVKSAKEQ